jgi:starch phosphorylase
MDYDSNVIIRSVYLINGGVVISWDPIEDRTIEILWTSCMFYNSYCYRNIYCSIPSRLSMGKLHIYNILENEVVPLYYSRGKDDLPRPWIHRMKTTIKWCTPRFNTSRMVGEYTKRFYMMAAEDWKELNRKSQAKAKEISTWKSYMKQHWGQLQISDVDIKVDNGNGFEVQDQRKSQIKVGSKLHVKALVRLGEIAPENISVQLYRGQVDSWGNIIDGTILEMAYKEPADEDKFHWFEGIMVCDNSGRQGVAVRLLPKYDGMACPHGLNLICWESQNNQTAAKVN